MHPISDKELDKLFQQRFEDAEIEPSANVWGKISDKMDRQKKVKSFPVLWMAAASVVIITGAALWFSSPVEVIKLQGSKAAVNNTDAIITTDAADREMSNVSELHNTELTRAKSAGVDPENYTLRSTPFKEMEIETITEQPAPDIASNASVKKVVRAVSKPEPQVKIPGNYTGDQSNLDVTQPDMMARAEFTEEDRAFEGSVNKDHKRIRSIGSLVNFVIAKVDKREDKLIEFKDGEEGSEIAGINLGLIKLNSKK